MYVERQGEPYNASGAEIREGGLRGVARQPVEVEGSVDGAEDAVESAGEQQAAVVRSASASPPHKLPT